MPLADGAPATAQQTNGVDDAPVLEVEGLETVFDTRDGAVHAVNGVSFHLRPGELLGVVGESGSGKSVTMMSALHLLPRPAARCASEARTWTR